MLHEYTVPSVHGHGLHADHERASRMHVILDGVKVCDGKTLTAPRDGWVLRHHQSPVDDGHTCMRCLKKLGVEG